MTPYETAGVTSGVSYQAKKAQGASLQYGSERFSGTVAISPPVISAYYRQAPNRGRELSFREAVLPLMYRVREDGLQTANASATHSSWVCPMECRRKPSMGIFGMSEPNTTCPHCKAEIALTEALTAPLIPAIHKKIAERE